MSDTMVYEIRDATARLAAKHHRIDNPDGTKKMWWEKDGKAGLNGTPLADLPLYGAELVSDTGPDELIVLCEGEKARDALEAAGLPAVGTVTGAGGTPGPEALEVLRDRRVALWRDNDEAGHAHMQRVGEGLQGVAAEVLWFEWHDAPEKGADAADHPAIKSRDEKAVDRLLNELESAPRFLSAALKREVPAERILKFKTAKELAEETPAVTEWVARPWIAKGAITEVDGKIKAGGKTTWVTHMVRKILDGESFMGEPTTKTKAVFLTEQPPASFRKALERADLLEREDLLILHWHDTRGVPWAEVARAAADKAVEIGAGALFVDTLGQFAGIRGDGENNAGAAQEAMRPLQEAAARGLAVVLTRHERKGGGEVGESGRGSSAFGGAVDVILSIRRGEGNMRPTVRVIESLSRFDETPDKRVVELTEGGYRSLGDATAFAEREAQDAILDVLPAKEEHAIKTDDLLDKLKEQDVKRTVAQTALSRLIEDRTVKRIGAGKRGDPYRHFLSAETPAPSGGKNTGYPPASSETPDDEEEILSAETSTYRAAERIPLSFDLRPGESATLEELRERRAESADDDMTWSD